jgi:hypothetical protein
MDLTSQVDHPIHDIDLTSPKDCGRLRLAEDLLESVATDKELEQHLRKDWILWSNFRIQNLFRLILFLVPGRCISVSWSRTHQILSRHNNIRISSSRGCKLKI